MTGNVTPFPVVPRVARLAPDPLGLYLRLGRNDHQVLLDLIAAGDAACFGAVLDPTLLKRHSELREQVLKHRLDAILDPKTQQSATLGGYTDALGALPWGVGRRHMPADFVDVSGRRLIAALGDFALEHGFTQVFAPTHMLRAADDEWLAVDVEAARRLRSYLDRNGGANVPIIYSLAVPYSVFRDRSQRRRLIEALETVPAAAIWLKVEGFGSRSSATAARTYIEATAEFHELGVPIVADCVGGLVGLSLLAFGAAGGIAHGVTLSERFDAGHWNTPQGNGGWSMQRRVYVAELDLMLKPKDAEILLGASSRARSLFGCKDMKCCRRGVTDMIENPGRHFLYQRIKEVSGLSQIPEELRPQRFLDRHLRPATDHAVAAANINWEDDTMAKRTRDHRKRLDILRVALGNYADKNPPQSFALLPKTRAVREGRR